MSVLGEDVNKTPAHEDLNALKLTTAVIKETQRYDCINVHFNGIRYMYYTYRELLYYEQNLLDKLYFV